MTRALRFLPTKPLLAFTIFFAALTACNNLNHETGQGTTTDSVADNIKMYSHVWDEIVNKRKLDMFNDSNFTKDVVMHASLHTHTEHYLS